MMHDAWGRLGMSSTMSLLIVLPIVALAVAVYALIRMQGRQATPPSASVLSAQAAAPAAPAQGLDASHRRLLDEDEQRLYDLVIARHGDIPQGDLVTLSGFSKAKVSRVIDRLEQKGLLLRLRRGMGNHVVVPPAKQP